MDQTAAQKQQKSRTTCEAAGWSFQPFVADTYGTLRADARGFVARFIKRYHHKFQPLDEAQAGRAISCTMSTVVISRAAQQLCRLSLIDNPLGLPLQALDLRSARSTSSTLPFAPPRLHDMGIILQQPSQDAEAEEDLLQQHSSAQHSSSHKLGPQPDTVMEELSHPSNANATATAATTAAKPTQTQEAENKLPRQTQLIFLRSTANGQSLPVYLEPGARLADLSQLSHTVQDRPLHTAYSEAMGDIVPHSPGWPRMGTVGCAGTLQRAPRRKESKHFSSVFRPSPGPSGG